MLLRGESNSESGDSFMAKSTTENKELKFIYTWCKSIICKNLLFLGLIGFSLSCCMWLASVSASCSITSQASSNGLEDVWVKTESASLTDAKFGLEELINFLSGLSSKFTKMPKSAFSEFTGVAENKI